MTESASPKTTCSRADTARAWGGAVLYMAEFPPTDEEPVTADLTINSQPRTPQPIISAVFKPIDVAHSEE